MWQDENLDDQYSKSLLNNLEYYGIHKNDLVIKSMKFAKFYHNAQLRKSGEPYYMHPIAVAKMILPYTKNTIDISAALLHDVVEDTDTNIETIKQYFGSRVSQIVDRLTRDRPDGTKLSIEAIMNNAYITNDRSVLLIKICDRIHNIMTLSHMNRNKIIKKIKETYEVRFLGYAATIDLDIEIMLVENLKKLS
jgi:GTP pyrophosphokinase